MATPDTPMRAQSFGEAKAIAERAIELLIRHAIAPSPLCYAVAYAYFSGTHPELQKALDQQLQPGRTLDEFALRDLHERHLSSDPYTRLRGVGDDLQRMLGTLARSVGEAGEGASAFGDALQSNLEQLDADAGPQTLQLIAGNMLAATRAMQESNRTMQQQLEATVAETESLRGELEKQRRDALTDPLTGLLNRRAMDVELDELMAVDEAEPLSVLMVDIDHFKRINDSYGHALGDAVIRNVAEVIRKCLRASDRAVRYGGEEFVVLLPGTSADGAASLAEMIRRRVETLRLVRRRDNLTLGPFTASLGVTARRHGDDRDSLLQRADQALYQAKRGGRNRVEAAA